MDGERFSSLTGLRAELNYLVPNGERPFSYQYDPPPGRPLRSGTYRAETLTVANGRLLPEAELDVEGFAFVAAPTAVDDFYAKDGLTAAYYPEVERIVAKATGASLVVAFDHTIRNGGARRAAAGPPVVTRVVTPPTAPCATCTGCRPPSGRWSSGCAGTSWPTCGRWSST